MWPSQPKSPGTANLLQLSDPLPQPPAWAVILSQLHTTQPHLNEPPTVEAKSHHTHRCSTWTCTPVWTLTSPPARHQSQTPNPGLNTSHPSCLGLCSSTQTSLPLHILRPHLLTSTPPPHLPHPPHLLLTFHSHLTSTSPFILMSPPHALYPPHLPWHRFYTVDPRSPTWLSHGQSHMLGSLPQLYLLTFLPQGTHLDLLLNPC